jgi:hypothetical protein
LLRLAQLDVVPGDAGFLLPLSIATLMAAWTAYRVLSPNSPAATPWELCTIKETMAKM